jgi:hypothetical protein
MLILQEFQKPSPERQALPPGHRFGCPSSGDSFTASLPSLMGEDEGTDARVTRAHPTDLINSTAC